MLVASMAQQNLLLSVVSGYHIYRERMCPTKRPRTRCAAVGQSNGVDYNGFDASAASSSQFGEVCHLLNRNSCSYTCRKHTHVCNGCSGNHPGVSCPYEGNGAHAEPILGCYTAQALPNYKLAVVDTHVWVQHWS